MAKRLKKGSTKTPTLSILIEFSSSSLPEYINIGYQRYSIRTYVPNPWQCFNCQRFGHNASDCKSKPKCLFCSDNHKSQSCPYRTDQDRVSDSSLKCANCSGNHAANYGGCTMMKEAKTVEKVRAFHKLSYRDALKSVKSANVNPISLSGNNSNHSLSASNNIMQNDSLNRSISVEPTSTVKNYKNSCTQTEEISPTENSNFIKNVSVLIIKLIEKFNVNTNTLGNKELDLVNVVKTVMGVDISNEILDNPHSSPHSKELPNREPQPTGAISKFQPLSGKLTNNKIPPSTQISTYNSHSKNKTGSPNNEGKRNAKKNKSQR